MSIEINDGITGFIEVIDNSRVLQNIAGANGVYNNFHPVSTPITNVLDFELPVMSLTMTGNVTFTESNISTGRTSLLLLDTGANQGGTIEYMIVAGGGSGGSYGGGGGAGGLLEGTLSVVSGSVYNFTVGAGGASVTTDYTIGNDGGNSTIFGLTAIGGGGGGGNEPSEAGHTGRPGGSGGGAGNQNWAGGASGGAGTAGQGNRGGNSNPQTFAPPSQRSRGGGGKQLAGTDSTEGSPWTQAQKLVGSVDFSPGFNLDTDSVSNSVVSVSSDGLTAIIGGGSTANIFTRSGTTWTEQAKLQPSPLSFGFGQSVSISGDGNTAIVGAYEDDTGATNAGSAYIFTRSGTSWTQQAKIQASDLEAGGRFGFSVGISSDGNTAIIGGTEHVYVPSPVGADAYIFIRSGTSWTQQAKLLPSDTNTSSRFDFGYSVSISGDGNTAIVGAPNGMSGTVANTGAAFIFVRSGSTWSQQRKLNGSPVLQAIDFGMSVALSSDGNTAIVGAEANNASVNNEGGAYIFTRSGTSWSQRAKLDGIAESEFGCSVDISDDGNTVVIGADHLNIDYGNYIAERVGRAYVYAKSASTGTWIIQRSLSGTISTSPNYYFGTSVSISGDGLVVFVTEPPRNAVYIRYQQPEVTGGSQGGRSGSSNIVDSFGPNSINPYTLGTYYPYAGGGAGYNGYNDGRAEAPTPVDQSSSNTSYGPPAGGHGSGGEGGYSDYTTGIPGVPHTGGGGGGGMPSGAGGSGIIILKHQETISLNISASLDFHQETELAQPSALPLSTPNYTNTYLLSGTGSIGINRYVPTFSSNIKWSGDGTAPMWSAYRYWEISFVCWDNSTVRAVAAGYNA